MTVSNSKWLSSSNTRNRTVVFDIEQEYVTQSYVNISELKINSTYNTIDYKSNYFAFLKKYDSTNWSPYVRSSSNSSDSNIQYLYMLHIIRIPVELYASNTEIITQINKSYSNSIMNILLNSGELITRTITNNGVLSTYVLVDNCSSRFTNDDMFSNFIYNINYDSFNKNMSYTNTVTNVNNQSISITVKYVETTTTQNFSLVVYNIDKNMNMFTFMFIWINDKYSIYISSDLSYIETITTPITTGTIDTSVIIDSISDYEFNIYMNTYMVSIDITSPTLSCQVLDNGVTNISEDEDGKYIVLTTSFIELMSGQIVDIITNYDTTSKTYTFSMDIIPVGINNSEINNKQQLTDEVSTSYDTTLYGNNLIYTDTDLELDISTLFNNYINNKLSSASIFYSTFNHNKIALSQTLNISSYSVDLDTTSVLYKGTNPYTPIIGNMMMSYVYTGETIYVNDAATNISDVQFVKNLRINTEDAHAYPITIQVCYTYGSNVDRIINNTKQMTNDNNIIVLSELNVSSDNISTGTNQLILPINKNISIDSTGVKVFITGKDIQYPFLKTNGWLHIINV